MRLLVCGASGMLGRELTAQAAVLGAQVTGTFHTRRPAGTADVDWRRLDPRHRERVHALVADVRPEVIIDAAYRQDDWATTADGPAHVALAAAASGARLVFVSSDAVFSGRDSPYAEVAPPDPVTAYGAAKAAAETAVRAISPAAVIARTSLIISGAGASAHEQRAVSAATDRTVALFTDDLRCPVHVEDLAGALLELAGSDRLGVHHLAGSDALSRYELGCLIAAREGLDPARIPRSRRADLDRPAPLDVRLDCQETTRHLRTPLRGARTFLRALA